MSAEEQVELRKRQRAEGVRLRESIEPGERERWDHAIQTHLAEGMPPLSDLVVGFCWPYKAEFDARPLVQAWWSSGARLALPAVVGKGQPLSFREWYPDAPMAEEVYGIPVPQGTPVLKPDTLLIPVNGFDARGYRLGYGGGYFDRTLASIEPRPIAIAIGYELLRLETIKPEVHDIPMDFVVTEAGMHAVEASGLVRLDAAESQQRVGTLIRTRRLPRSQGDGD
jgi:5-formyltetrahydrofolate cyclo-ligase